MPDRISDRRERKAARTKAEIVVAARRLFAERGFSATTVADVAEEADVAVQTIYSHVGSKSDLVLALVDSMDATSGGREAGIAISSAPTPEAVVAAGVGFTRRLHEGWGDVVAALHAAAPTDESAARALSEGLMRHRGSGIAMATRLDELGALSGGMSVDDAGSVISVLTSHETYRQFVRDHAWSYDHCEQRLRQMLERILF